MKQRFTCGIREKLIEQLRKLSDGKKNEVLNSISRLENDTSKGKQGENAEGYCCTLLFIFYLCFCCKDCEGLIAQIRRILIDFLKNEQPN